MREDETATPNASAMPKPAAPQPEQPAEDADVQPTADMLQGEPARAEPEAEESGDELYWLDEGYHPAPATPKVDFEAKPAEIAPNWMLAATTPERTPAAAVTGRTAAGTSTERTLRATATEGTTAAEARPARRRSESGPAISLSLIVMAIIAALVSAAIVLIFF
jgi:hypothetical protein